MIKFNQSECCQPVAVKAERIRTIRTGLGIGYKWIARTRSVPGFDKLIGLRQVFIDDATQLLFCHWCAYNIAESNIKTINPHTGRVSGLVRSIPGPENHVERVNRSSRYNSKSQILVNACICLDRNIFLIGRRWIPLHSGAARIFLQCFLCEFNAKSKRVHTVSNTGEPSVPIVGCIFNTVYAWLWSGMNLSDLIMPETLFESCESL